MNMKQRRLLVVGLLLLLCFGCKSKSPRRDQLELYRHPGVQWLSWTPAEREKFVFGYEEGYGSGTYLACRSANDLFETDKPHAIGYDSVPSTFPSARCRANIAQYSNVKFSETMVPDFSPYTDVITSFYNQYPEYPDIHSINLMAHLAGAKLKTVDDLYSLAKEEKLATLPH